MRSSLAATVTVLLLNMTGASATVRVCEEQSAPARTPASVSTDLDGDGSSDTATADIDDLRLHLSRGGRLILHGHTTISAVAAEDLDGDGDGDLVALSNRGTLLVWRNNGAGRFSYQPPELPATGPAQWWCGRMDNGNRRNPCTTTSARGSSLDLGTPQAPRAQFLDRAGPIVPGTTGLRPPSTPRPGSPRSPPVC
jgi:VCBS repeat protein